MLQPCNTVIEPALVRDSTACLMLNKLMGACIKSAEADNAGRIVWQRAAASHDTTCPVKEANRCSDLAPADLADTFYSVSQAGGS